MPSNDHCKYIGNMNIRKDDLVIHSHSRRSLSLSTLITVPNLNFSNPKKKKVETYRNLATVNCGGMTSRTRDTAKHFTIFLDFKILQEIEKIRKKCVCQIFNGKQEINEGNKKQKNTICFVWLRLCQHFNSVRWKFRTHRTVGRLASD